MGVKLRVITYLNNGLILLAVVQLRESFSKPFLFTLKKPLHAVCQHFPLMMKIPEPKLPS